MIHAAAEVNMIKPVALLSHANVGGTANVLGFCAAARAPQLFLDYLPQPGEEPTGYRQSKEAGDCMQACTGGPRRAVGCSTVG